MKRTFTVVLPLLTSASNIARTLFVIGVLDLAYLFVYGESFDELLCVIDEFAWQRGHFCQQQTCENRATNLHDDH